MAIIPICVFFCDTAGLQLAPSSFQSTHFFETSVRKMGAGGHRRLENRTYRSGNRMKKIAGYILAALVAAGSAFIFLRMKIYKKIKVFRKKEG